MARNADAAGVDRIGVDLERLGKAKRQRGLGTWISSHTVSDLVAVSSALDRAKLFARLNAMHPGTRAELDAVVQAGARVVMLPMVANCREAEAFVELVDRRALVVLLVEHVDALRQLDELLAVAGVDEVHVGLNDLALSLGLPNRWLVLTGDLVVQAGRQVREAGLRFGLGGIARVDDNSLPVPADLVYAQYARTGATAALISRSFLGADGQGTSLTAEIARARARLAGWYRAGPDALQSAHAELCRRARSSSSW